MIWVLIGAIAVVSGFYLYQCLMHPQLAAGDETAQEIDTYKKQLGQIDSDMAQGLIGTEEAAALRLEVQRGLLQAAKASDGIGVGADAGARVQVSKPVALGLALGVPLVALALYGVLGAPQLARPGGAGAPQAEMTRAQQVAAVSQMADKFKGELEAGAPDAATGMKWGKLGSIYMQLSRLEDAQYAYEKAIAAGFANAQIYAGLGEARLYLNDGKMNDAARAAFEQALAQEPSDPASRFYLALGARQNGDAQGSYDQFKALAADTPANAPWAEMVREEAAKSAAALNLPEAELAFADPVVPSGPSQADIEAAKNMSPDDQKAMIESMVARLAQRLEEDPSDFDGWLKLARAYSVMGQPDKAGQALQSAAKTFPDRTEELGQAATDLGLGDVFK